MDKEVYFYKRTIYHISRVYQNVVRFIEGADEIIDKYKIDRLTVLKSVLDHDRGKFKEPEYDAYVEMTWYYYSKRILGIDNYPIDEIMSSNATIHHIISAKHHPEYWDKEFIVKEKFKFKDRDQGNPDNPVDAKDMPLEYIVEMVCDWKAVADELGNSVREWADKTVNKRWKFTEEQVNLIYDIINYFESLH